MLVIDTQLRSLFDGSTHNWNAGPPIRNNRSKAAFWMRTRPVVTLYSETGYPEVSGTFPAFRQKIPLWLLWICSDKGTSARSIYLWTNAKGFDPQRLYY